MSYAAVAAHNAPPVDEQPQPDPALLNTEKPVEDNVADDAAKVNVVSPDFKENPATITSQAQIIVDYEDEPAPARAPAPAPSTTNEKRKKKVQHKLEEVEEEGIFVWNVIQRYLLRPGVAGGLIGIVNIGLLAGAGRAFYAQPHLRSDTKVISSVVAGGLVLLGAEGFAAEQYAQTEAGKVEAKKAKKEGAALYKHTREVVLRPGVMGGLLGVVNTGVIGTIGYFAYTNWDQRHWDRRTVSAVSVALLTLWGGEGYMAERYRQEHA